MGKMSFKRAKDLSEKKWKFIVENNGSEIGILKKIPTLKNMYANCAMCQYQFGVVDSNCDPCIYTDICDNEHRKWVISSAGQKELAQNVLDAIIEANKNSEKHLVDSEK